MTLPLADQDLLVQVRADNLHDCVRDLEEGNVDLLVCYTHPGLPLQLEPARYPSLMLARDTLTPVSKAAADGRPLHALRPGSTGPVPWLSYSADAFLGRVSALALDASEPALAVHPVFESALVEALRATALEGLGADRARRAAARPRRCRGSGGRQRGSTAVERSLAPGHPGAAVEVRRPAGARQDGRAGTVPGQQTHAHAAQFESWSARPSTGFDIDALRRRLARMPAGVLRLKGFVRSDEGAWWELQFAGRHLSMRKVPTSRHDGAGVVAIGLRGRLPHADLESLFSSIDGCV